MPHWEGEQWQCLQNRHGQLGSVSNTHAHVYICTLALTCTDICLSPIPVHHLFNQKNDSLWLAGHMCVCTHAHTHVDTSFLLIQLRTCHKHTPSNIRYTDTLLTETCKPQAHAPHKAVPYTAHTLLLFALIRDKPTYMSRLTPTPSNIQQTQGHSAFTQLPS